MAAQHRRLLFLMSRFLDGGIDTVLVEYIRHLSRDPRYSVTLAIATCMGGMEVYLCNIPATVNVVHLVSNRLLTAGPKARVQKRISKVGKVVDEALANPLRRAIVWMKLRQLARRHDVIVDFDCCFYSPLQGVAKPKVAFFHFTFDLIAQQDPRRMQRLAARLGQYDHIVLLSNAILSEGKRLFPQLAERFTVVYNPKDVVALRAAASEEVSHPLIAQDYVLAVERLTEPKDLATLLRAFSLLQRQYGHASLQLAIIGKGEQMPMLQQLAEQLQLAASVTFLGFVGNPHPWISRCRLFAFSSKSEGLGMSIVEALLHDRPIVATDCPTGPREVLAEGRAGLLTPVGDADAMALAMHRLLTDTSLQQQQAEGRRQQAQRFTFATAGHQLDRLFGTQEQTSL